MSEQLLRPDDWDEPVQIPDPPEVSAVLVPFDGSHSAERALAWAEGMVSASGGEVIVMVAYEPPLTKKGRGSSYVEAITAAMEEEAKLLAAEAVELLVSRGVRSRGIVVRGEASAAALDTAESEGCAAVVLGRRGLSTELEGLAGALERLRSAVHGGVSERVARLAQIPVMVV